MEPLVKKHAAIATAILLLPTLFALAEDVRPTLEVIQQVTIGDDGVVTSTITENGVTRAPVVSVLPEGGELAIVGGQIITALNNSAPALGNDHQTIEKNLGALIQQSIKDMAPQLRKRMAEQHMAELSALSKNLGMSADEFDAIKPLIAAVENLRQQKSIIDDPAKSRMGGAFDRGPFASKFYSDPQMLLGDTPLEPTIAEIQKSAKALRALIDDKQANASELTSAMVRLRKSRDGFFEVLEKAQKDLRAVLTPAQEAVLVVRGTLE
jgi:Spy/CpxP family protein refolding chaperone